MLKTIPQLYNGNLEPVRSIGVNNSAIRQAERLIERNREKFEKDFDEKTNELFEKYNDCINEYEVLLAEQAFCEGFCLGARITAEALIVSEKQCDFCESN